MKPVRILLDPEQSCILDDVTGKLSASVQRSPRGGRWMLTVKPEIQPDTKPMFAFLTPKPALKRTTPIRAGRISATLARVRGTTEKSVAFMLKGDPVRIGKRGSANACDVTLPLIDAALTEAQAQVNELRLPGAFYHYTPGGHQMIIKIRPARR